MLLDTRKPALLILDDALAHADSNRLERLFYLLSHASSRLQILVLTCRGELFTPARRSEGGTASPNQVTLWKLGFLKREPRPDLFRKMISLRSSWNPK